MAEQWIEHLEGLAKLEKNIGKQAAFTTSAEKLKVLQQENDELKATVEELRDASSALINDVINRYKLQSTKDLQCGYMIRLSEAINRTPAQNLAEVQAKAVEVFMEEMRECSSNAFDNGYTAAGEAVQDMCDKALEHIQQLREEAKDE